MLTQNNKKMRKKKQLIKWNTISTKYPYMTIAVVAMHTWHYSNSEDERIKNDEKVSSLVRNVIMLINFPLARMHSPHMLLAHVCVIESTIYGIPIAQFKLRQRVCFFSFSHSLYICYADGSLRYVYLSAEHRCRTKFFATDKTNQKQLIEKTHNIVIYARTGFMMKSMQIYWIPCGWLPLHS